MLLCFGLIAVVLPLMEGPLPSGLVGDAVGSASWLANWRFIFAERTYADVFASPSPFQHFWSLAVEEQFYVFFPLVFTAVSFRRSATARRWLLGSVPSSSRPTSRPHRCCRAPDVGRRTGIPDRSPYGVAAAISPSIARTAPIRSLRHVLRRLRLRPRAFAAPHVIMLLAVVGVLAPLIAVAVPDGAGEQHAAVGLERSRSVPPVVRELWAALDGAGAIDEPPAPAAATAAAVSDGMVTGAATDATSTVPPPAGPVVNEPPPGPDRSAPPPPPDPPPMHAESTAVYPENFPDPFVTQSHGVYWAFSTQVGLTEIPTLRSMDLVNWQWVGDALKDVPAWAESGHNWAPSVLERGSGFVLYYTTRHRATGLQCISRATSVLPQGPYLDDSTAPLVCQTDRGGSIDPSPFVDADGLPWLLWKSEGTLQGEPTRIWVQPLSIDGLRLVDAPTQLLERWHDWEFPIIEGPSMALVDGRHHLFYSGNRWETADYAVGHAVCDSVTGPCRRTSSRPVLASRSAEVGPGGQEVVRAPSGELVLVHHAWEPGAAGYATGGARQLHISSLHFDGDHVAVGGPWGRRGGGSLVDGLGPSGTRGGAGDRPPLRRLG